MNRWLVAFILILSFQPWAFAQGPLPPIDIIFDIDWTTFYTIDPKDPAQQTSENVSVEGKTYRATDHLGKVIEILLKDHPEVRISFFSGGERTRNEQLLKTVRLSDGRTLFDIAYKVLSKEHLTVVSQNENLGFSERYKKVVEKHIPDWNPARTILIDDQKNFAVKPLKAVSSLGHFNFQKRFNARAATELYYPSDVHSWDMERNKALLWLAMLESSIQESRQSGTDFATATENTWKMHAEDTVFLRKGRSHLEMRSCEKVFAF
ncbi:hypothetical protein [Bdellovibrio bacteriovorus]|uniref:hypothetical protein n=1 Tax=Bdellovibrio bacteriovorus TaxID=959 RepID=UPI0035A6E630